MDISMTVRREDLITALTAKRDEIAATYREKLESREDDQTAIDDYTTSFVERRKQITDMLEAGTATLDFNSCNETPNIIPVGTSKFPKPVKITDRLREIFYRKQQDDTLLKQIDERVAPYNAALQLLNMSDDENVGVPATEYQRLLEGRPVGQDPERLGLRDHSRY